LLFGARAPWFPVFPLRRRQGNVVVGRRITARPFSVQARCLFGCGRSDLLTGAWLERKAARKLRRIECRQRGTGSPRRTHWGEVKLSLLRVGCPCPMIRGPWIL
jgi:hypothetical protein